MPRTPGTDPQPSCAELLGDFQSGRSSAFTALVTRHEGALLYHARSLLGDRSAADDAVQEAFLRLAQHPPDLEDNVDTSRKQLSSWLHCVTRNLCMDAIRSEKSRRGREAAVAPGEAIRGGIDTVEAADTRAAVRQGLDRLPPDQKEVLSLRLLSDKSYREIADVTGRKVGTVGWLVSEGLERLADELSELAAFDLRQA